jgi:hypothetical protein
MEYPVFQNAVITVFEQAQTMLPMVTKNETRWQKMSIFVYLSPGLLTLPINKPGREK